MRRLVLGLLLAVSTAGGVAFADSSPAQLQATDRAEAAVTAAAQRVNELAAKHQALATRYENELRAIDKLKKQRASWRRDREIAASSSVSVETAKQLGVAARDLATAQSALATARRALIAAATSERPNATGARAQKLEKLVGSTPAAKKVHKIKLPSGEIDPLADPEELDEQAQQLRDSEAELQKQVTALEGQAKELDRVATLRKQHERAGELNSRDDDTPRRGTQPTAASRGGKETAQEDNAPAPQAGLPPTSDPADAVNGPGGGMGFESEATVVLGDVIDASTIDKLQKAQRSGDPAVRAAAAKQARDAVAARLAQLKAQRAQVEARAKALRGK